MTNDGSFGEAVAARYDETSADMFDPTVVEPAVDLLAELAGNGAALEMAIGTGSIALPLAARGVEVHGIELSKPMVAKLREKPGGDAIGVTIGDMSTTRAPGLYRLVYLVYNTIMTLTSPDAQLACFRNAAAHLEPGGHFVIKVGAPGLDRLAPGETRRVFDITDDHVGIDEYDVATQGLVSHHFRRHGRHWELVSMPFRYVWPDELNAMAAAAGLRLRDRWESWSREPFTMASRGHVSVWAKADVHAG